MTLQAATWLLSLAATASPTTDPPPAPAAVALQDLEGELTALQERLDRARKDFSTKMRALQSTFDREKATDEQRVAFEAEMAELAKSDPAPGFLEEFEALAQRAKGSEVAATSWIRVVELDGQARGAEADAGRPRSERALAVLLADHAGSRELSALPRLVSARAFGEERQAELMRELREKSPHRDIQAQALFALVRTNLPYGGATDEQRERARGLLKELAEHYAEVAMTPKKTFGEAAAAYQFELDRLQIGMVAPDFETSDENGASFKLSDYRGKVVVLDFWGLW
jgi:hypothetical protein